jgi:phosphoribosylaminoimidazole-succinocarboxamide synthase
MLGQKAKRYDVECVVRGYLAGSGWKEYQASGSVCGVKLPPGLKLSSKLPEPIFTPATKAASGHDENISFERMCEVVGKDVPVTDTPVAQPKVRKAPQNLDFERME